MTAHLCVTGWRFWACIDGVLCSPFLRATGSDLVRGQRSEAMLARRWNSSRGITFCPHEPPMRDCECGIYIQDDLPIIAFRANEWLRYEEPGAMAVFGRVEIWHVYDGPPYDPGTKRGAIGYIQELFVPRLLADATGTDADVLAHKLAAYYQVPVRADWPNGFERELAGLLPDTDGRR
jgi:hypothetical protein